MKNRGIVRMGSIIVVVISFFISTTMAMGFENRSIADSVFAVKDSLNSTKIIIEQAKKPALSFSGYFDTYYFGNFNNPSTRDNLGSSGISRGFDRYVGQFQLGMVMAHMGYSYKNAELVTELGWGPNISYASYGSNPGYRFGSLLARNTSTSVFIKQAYINYKPTDKFTITMGQFGTHIGYEVIDAPLNFHYSINNTFNAGIPFYHLGLKGTYAPNENVSLMAGLVNGTDNINDNNRAKSFIGQIALTPAKDLKVYINTIQGNEANARANGKDTTSYFGIIDFSSTYQVSSRLQLSAWLMYGSLKGEYQGGRYSPTMIHWSGENLYTQYRLNKSLIVGTRLEHFDNSSGARPLLTNGLGTSVNSITLTANVSLADDTLILKPELRIDSFQKMRGPNNEVQPQQFVDSNGNFTKNSQTTLGMAAIFKF